MSALGPTWATAGTITLGTGNTFDIADATEPGGPRPYWRAWGRYTAPANGNLTLDTLDTTGGDPALIDTIIQVYPNSVSAPADFDWIARNDDSHGGLLSEVTLPVTAGATYYVLIGSFDSDGDTITTYRLRAALQVLVTRSTAWSSALRDRTDNQLIVGTDWLIQENPNPTYRTDPGWYLSLVAGGGAPGRRMHYRIQQALGGYGLLNDATLCAWKHAVNGDQSTTAIFWNTTTTDPDDTGTPTCHPLGDGVSDDDFSTGTGWRIQYLAAELPFLGQDIQVDAWQAAFAAAFRYARDHLGPAGTLDISGLDPVADGVPVEYAGSAVLEWEGDRADLTGIDITGDAGGDGDLGADNETTYFWDDAVLPTFDGTEWSLWDKGIPSSLQFTYRGGIHWNTLTGFTGWEDVADDGTDLLVGSALTSHLDDTVLPGPWTHTDPDTDQTVEVGVGTRVGYRLDLQAKRYRWTWEEEAPTTVPVPVRKTPRRDGDGYESATRVLASIPAERHIGGLWD